ncbi:MAG TPA: hypothetical protein VN456_12665 [Desulfosporosinus sp.]|nr:hypothetical protein [Desulfosporosinus sp.]
MSINLKSCKACGKEIGETVTKCIHCGTDQRNFFLKHKIITFFLVMFVIGTINRALGTTIPTASTPAITNTSPAQAKQEPVKAEADSIKITAKALLDDYESNEVKADLMYKGKLVEVNGIVDDIRVTFGKTAVSLSAGNSSSLNNVTCYFDDKTEDNKVADLKKGDQVTISGVVNGKMIIGVGVDNSMVKQLFQR